MSALPQNNLNELLRATSRSFYLTLRVLPRAIRPQIGLAYLLARTTDTIADTEIIPVARRLEALQTLREKIQGQNSAPVNFGELAQSQALPAEKWLLEKTDQSLALLATLSPEDLIRVRAVLLTITSGQELDLQRFGSAGSEKIVALKTEAELDDYTYRVAGCVGEFWTQMCRAHLFPNATLDDKQFLADGIRFGQGLQLVNILRDLPADLKIGRCYLPLGKFSAAGLTPENFLRAENEKRFLPLFHGYLDQAEAQLAAGWRYTNLLPFGQFRVRLGCAWLILIGAPTLEKLRRADVNHLRQRVKVSRGEVYSILLRSTLASPLPWVWRKLYFPARKAVASGSVLA